MKLADIGVGVNNLITFSSPPETKVSNTLSSLCKNLIALISYP
jgi:hypothetical protein